MKISKLLERAVHLLEKNNIDDARANAEFLLAAALGAGRAHLLAFSGADVSAQQEELFNSYLSQKLIGQPLQYILKTQPFCGYNFEVNPSVLIPRPETEELVAGAVLRAKTPLKILDMCTGSGCIACVLALEFTQAAVTAADVSAAALNTAAQNARNLNVKNITFINSDLFANIDGKFDIIVTNPPYIPTEDLKGLQAEVRCEPALALDGGPDGLTLIKRIINAAPAHLNPGGLLAMEFGINEGPQIAALLDDKIWCTKEFKKDTFNVERFLFAIRK